MQMEIYFKSMNIIINKNNMRITFLTILLVLSLNMFAQYKKLWQTGLYGNNADIITSVYDTKQGCHIAGSFSDSISINNSIYHSNGGKDIFFFNCDVTGKIKGVICYGDNGDDIPTNVTASDDIIYLGGINSNIDSIYDGSIFIHSYDTIGNLLLETTIPYKGHVCLDVIKVTDNFIYLAGSLTGQIVGNNYCIISMYSEHSFLLCLTKTGDFVSKWHSEGNGKHRLFTFDSNDSISLLLISANKGSFITDSISPIDVLDNAIIGLTLDDKLKPQKTFCINSSNYIEASDIVFDKSGITFGINYSGNVSWEDTLVSSSTQLSSMMVHCNNDISIDWVKMIESNYCRLLDLDYKDSLFYCIGYFHHNITIDSDTIMKSDCRNAFLLSFDNNGNLFQSGNIVFGDNSIGRKIICDSDKNIIVCGSIYTDKTLNTIDGISQLTNRKMLYVSCYNNVESDEKRINVNDSTCNTYCQIDKAELSDNIINEEMEIDIFPNPCTHSVSWNADEAIIVNSIDLFDSRGVLLYKEQLNHKTLGYVDMSLYPSGIYVLKFICENNKIRYKEIIKM